jgi:hypothetical protein
VNTTDAKGADAKGADANATDAKGNDVRADDVNAADKPIGYWLKHLHNLIEAQFDATLSDLHLGRRHWQVLNLLAGATYPRTQIEHALAPFWQNTALELDAVLDGRDGLITLGWVEAVAGSTAVESAAADNAVAGNAAAGSALALTEKGRTAYTTVSARVAETRGRLLRGLTLEQYVETVRVLSVMAENVESALADTAVSATSLPVTSGFAMGGVAEDVAGGGASSPGARMM